MQKYLKRIFTQTSIARKASENNAKLIKIPALVKLLIDNSRN